MGSDRPRTGLDICERCHRSAEVALGRAGFTPMSEPSLAEQFPYEWEFVCANCVKRESDAGVEA